MQYILGFYPAITALGIRESEIQHPATPSHENHEFCKQHGPEPRFPGHINGYNPACQLLRSNAGTPNSWVYSDTAVQTLKALTSIQTRVSTRYLNSTGPLTRAPVIAPKRTDLLWQIFATNAALDLPKIGQEFGTYSSSPSTLTTARHTSQVCASWRQLIIDSPSQPITLG